jgi:hypothetical protein
MLPLLRPPVPASVAIQRSDLSPDPLPFWREEPIFLQAEAGGQRPLLLLDDKAHTVMHKANLICVTGELEPGTVLVNRSRRQLV